MLKVNKPQCLYTKGIVPYLPLCDYDVIDNTFPLYVCIIRKITMGYSIISYN